MIVAFMTAVMVTAAPVETELEGVIELSRAPGGAVVILKRPDGAICRPLGCTAQSSLPSVPGRALPSLSC